MLGHPQNKISFVGCPGILGTPQAYCLCVTPFCSNTTFLPSLTLLGQRRSLSSVSLRAIAYSLTSSDTPTIWSIEHHVFRVTLGYLNQAFENTIWPQPAEFPNFCLFLQKYYSQSQAASAESCCVTCSCALTPHRQAWKHSCIPPGRTPLTTNMD